MTYSQTLDKLRKVKGQKTPVPEELRKRDAKAREEKPTEEPSKVKASD